MISSEESNHEQLERACIEYPVKKAILGIENLNDRLLAPYIYRRLWCAFAFVVPKKTETDSIGLSGLHWLFRLTSED